tara:strand:+ start:483 stop:944 length:462 start_codon:yes stop_codon:yes gene_type:complete
MYTAAILTPNSSGLLRYAAEAAGLVQQGFIFDSPLEGRPPYPHHMTINLGGIDEEINEAGILGQTARLYVKKIKWCERLGVCAAPVFKAEVEMKEFPAKYWTELYSFNVHPHITVCTMPHVKPRLSNDMLENGDATGLDLHQTYMLDAVVREI